MDGWTGLVFLAERAFACTLSWLAGWLVGWMTMLCLIANLDVC